MPSFITVVEDTAPFLTYSEGNWRPGTSNDDKLLDKYSDNSFTVTSAQNAAMSFSFYGGSVGIYGAKRANHGRYQVTIDGQTFNPESAAGPDAVNATLFFTALPKGEHSVRLINTEAKFRDIDYISFEQSVGQDDEPLIVNTVQDSHPAFDYAPANQWGTSPPFVASYSGGDGHSTNIVGSAARLRFKGDAVALYGPSGAQAAPLYTVKVDQRQSQSFSAAKFPNQPFRSKQLMYYAGGLGPGDHELVVTLGAVSSPNQYLAIDYAEIYTTPSLGGRFAAVDGSNASSSAPTGLIAAVAITGALAVICLGLLIWIFLLVKQGKLRRPDSEKNYPDLADVTPQTPQGINLGLSPMAFQTQQLSHYSQPTPSNATYSPYPPSERNMRSPTEFSQGHAGAVSDTATFTSGSSGSRLQPSRSTRKARNEIRRDEAQETAPPLYSS